MTGLGRFARGKPSGGSASAPPSSNDSTMVDADSRDPSRDVTDEPSWMSLTDVNDTTDPSDDSDLSFLADFGVETPKYPSDPYEDNASSMSAPRRPTSHTTPSGGGLRMFHNKGLATPSQNKSTASSGFRTVLNGIRGSLPNPLATLSANVSYSHPMMHGGGGGSGSGSHGHHGSNNPAHFKYNTVLYPECVPLEYRLEKHSTKLALIRVSQHDVQRVTNDPEQFTKLQESLRQNKCMTDALLRQTYYELIKARVKEMKPTPPVVHVTSIMTTTTTTTTPTVASGSINTQRKQNAFTDR